MTPCIFYFWSFESVKSIIVKCLDSFSKQIYNIWVIFRLIIVFETTANLQYFPLAFFLIGSLMRLLYLKPRYGTSSAFLMNIFFALKGSKLFFILLELCSYLCGSPLPAD